MRSIKWKEDEKGFGLLEILMAMIVLTLMLAIGTPLLARAIKSFQLAADAQNIASQLLPAKFRAASQREVPIRVP